MTTLVLCGSCSRHYRNREVACPFCGSRRTAAGARQGARLRASRSRIHRASALFMASGAALWACDGSDMSVPGGTATTTGGDGAATGVAGGGGSSTTTSRGGSNGTSTGTNAGSSATSGGGSSTGDAAGASSGGANTSAAGNVSSSGSAGDGGISGLGGATPGEDCPDATPRAETDELCRSASDCTSRPGDFADCVMAPSNPPSGPACRPVAQVAFECFIDGDCSEGQVCSGFDGCFNFCQDPCTADSCDPQQKCVDQRCVDKLCDEEGATPCAEGQTCDPASEASGERGCRLTLCDEPEFVGQCTERYECAPDSSTTQPNGCSAIACTEPGGECGDNAVCEPENAGDGVSGCRAKQCSLGEYDCPTNQHCAAEGGRPTGWGCRQLECTTDQDCDCGYCVRGTCEATLGICEYIIAMPYGCVWPDEEFV